MEAHLDSQRFIDAIAKDPTNAKEAQDLKNKGYIQVHPLESWIPYLANFANKFYVDKNGVMKAPGNLPVTALQKAFTDVKSQLSNANESIDSLKQSNADLVKQVNSISSDNQSLAESAQQAKENAQQSSKIMSGLVGQLFQLKAQLSAKK